MTSGDYLSPDVMGRDDFPRLLREAEQTVVDRYREETRAATDLYFSEDQYASPVRLEGWREKDDGTPDVEAMDDRLVDALNQAIARLITWRVEAPERGVSMEARGSRSINYRATGVPPRVYAPLRQYDDRTPFH